MRSDQQHFNHFSLEQFRAGVHSTVYKNAPAGVIFEGDPGYPGTRSASSTQRLRAAAVGRLGSEGRRAHDAARARGTLLRPAAHLELPRLRSRHAVRHRARRQQRHVRRSVGQYAWRQSVSDRGEPEHELPALRRVRHVPARHAAAVRSTSGTSASSGSWARRGWSRRTT